jgi:hypothetical protein
MATSVWGQVRQDTIDRVGRIVPTLDDRQRWRHTPDSRSGRTDTSSIRSYTTREVQAREHVGVAGGGEREEQWAVVLTVQYLADEAVSDRIGCDHGDLIAALQPISTYPSGLRVRMVEQPEIERDDETGRVTARWPIRCTFRYAVTLV